MVSCPSAFPGAGAKCFPVHGHPFEDGNDWDDGFPEGSDDLMEDSRTDTPAADATAPSDELQFDRVDTGSNSAGELITAPAVSCAACNRAVDTEYYLINGTSVCDSCLQAVAAAATPARGLGRFFLAGLFGVGAAIAGAILYYGVIAITNLEIGIVAIVIGYMVGWAVRRGAAGRGGRRFQILALILTYWSVGLAYAPLAYQAIKSKQGADASAASAGKSAATPDTAAKAPTGDAAKGATGGETPPAVGVGDLLLAFGLLFVFVFALPVLFIAGSMPGGLISALIIFFGLRQAWRMTGVPALDVSGPYKVGPGLSAVAG